MTIHEPIDMTAKDHGYFPKSFLWRGRRYTVDAVEQCWTVARRHWMGRIERHGFKVRTRKATYVLYTTSRAMPGIWNAPSENDKQLWIPNVIRHPD